MRSAALMTMLALASACGSSDDARVRIDLAPLWQQSAQSVDTIWVRVFDAAGIEQVSQWLYSFDDEADLVVVAGPSVRFEIEALTTSSAPSFWGEAVRDLAAGSDITLTVPVFPAGGVAGTVAVTDSTPIPPGTVVLATAGTPRADAPAQRQLVIEAGSFTGTLPDGNYDLGVSFDDSGTPYGGSVAVTVVREQIVSGITLSVSP